MSKFIEVNDAVCPYPMLVNINDIKRISCPGAYSRRGEEAKGIILNYVLSDKKVILEEWFRTKKEAMARFNELKELLK